MTRDEILATIDKAFRCERPVQMVRNPRHCCECAEHEEVMQGVAPESISLAQVGNAAWDPVCYLSDKAFGYFMPGLARLAFGRGEEAYIDQFLFHLESGRTDALNAAQSQAVAALLDHVLETMFDEVERCSCTDMLGHAMDRLAVRFTAS